MAAESRLSATHKHARILLRISVARFFGVGGALMASDQQKRLNRCWCDQCSVIVKPTFTEEFRHECEVRSVEVMGVDRQVGYLVGVMKKRGRAGANRIIEGLSIETTKKFLAACRSLQ